MGLWTSRKVAHRDGAKKTNTLISLSSLLLNPVGVSHWPKPAGSQRPRKSLVILKDVSTLGRHLRGFRGVHRRHPAHLDIYLLVVGSAPPLECKFQDRKDFVCLT